MTSCGDLDLLARCIDAPAVTEPLDGDSAALREGKHRLALRELASQVDERSEQLVSTGHGPGTLVAIPGDPTLDSVVTLLAALAINAAFVPLGPNGATPRVTEALNGDLRLPPDAAYIMTTSGSSGEPKEAAVTRTALRHVFLPLRERLAFPPGLRWTQLHPFSFGYSMCEVFGSLAHQGELVILPRDQPFTGISLVKECADNDSDAGLATCLTPSELSILTTQLLDTGVTLPSHIILSGEPAHRGQLEEFFSLAGAEACRVVNTYALTETSGQITTSVLSAGSTKDAFAGNVGHPLPGITVAIKNSLGRTLGIAQTETPGEIWISGPTVAAGYLEGEQTRQSFSGPRNNRAFRTGDIGRWAADGSLVVTGRSSRRVKVSGKWVEPEAIERELLKLGGLREVAVTAARDEGDPTAGYVSLVVVAVPREDDGNAAVRIRRLVVATYGGPIRTRLLLQQGLPRLSNGKLDVNAALAAANAPFVPAPTPQSADNSSVELAIRRIFQEMLGDALPEHANLFEVGLDSLGAVRAASRLSIALGRSVPPTVILEAPRIASLVALLSSQNALAQTPSPSRNSNRLHAQREARRRST